MKAFRLDDLEAERAANDGAYLQFLRERNMSVGLYALDAGELDHLRAALARGGLAGATLTPRRSRAHRH